MNYIEDFPANGNQNVVVSINDAPSLVPAQDADRNSRRFSTPEEVTQDVFNFGTSYPALPGHKRGETSAAAAEAMSLRAPGLRQRIARTLADIYPADLTPDEAARQLELTPFAVRPRFTELAAAGLIEKSGERRENPISGLKASAYRATALLLGDRDNQVPSAKGEI
jgi:hypothetical protein